MRSGAPRIRMEARVWEPFAEIKGPTVMVAFERGSANTEVLHGDLRKREIRAGSARARNFLHLLRFCDFIPSAQAAFLTQKKSAKVSHRHFYLNVCAVKSYHPRPSANLGAPLCARGVISSVHSVGQCMRAWSSLGECGRRGYVLLLLRSPRLSGMT